MSNRVLALCALVSLPGSILLAGMPAPAAGQIPATDLQIASAVLPAPADQREGAAVLGFDTAGELVTLRKGTNELVCLADDPSDEGFSAACYHESLEPYMARGRELRAQGVTDGNERNQIRWREAEEGVLPMPQKPATLYVLTGNAYDARSGEVGDAYLRFVVYMPWATVEETGLSSAPMTPGSPWLMYPGTAGAHVMISPPRMSPGTAS